MFFQATSFNQDLTGWLQWINNAESTSWCSGAICTPDICNAKNKFKCAKKIALGCVFMNKKCVECSTLNGNQCKKSDICIVTPEGCAACSDMKGRYQCVEAECSFE